MRPYLRPWTPTLHRPRMLRLSLLVGATALAWTIGCQSRGSDETEVDANATLGNTNDALTGGNQATQVEPVPVPVSEPNVPVSEPNNANQPVNGNATLNPNLRLIGRFDTSDANGPIMSWPGSKIVAGFSGTSLKITLRAVDQQTYYRIGNVNNYVGVSIDGNQPSIYEVVPGTNVYALAQNLTVGNHTVELTKRTEAQIGSLQFLGFTLDGGAKLVPGPTPRTRRIEFIGDSGTVGYGADGNWAATRCSFTPATENVAVAYSMVTGDLLAADVHVTANSGKGLYQNRDTVNDKYNTLPVLWTWTSGDTLAQPQGANAATYDPNSWRPDAVVVVVGGNDFAASTPAAQAYNATATAFLRKLRAAYPSAWLFVTISPMLDPPVDGETQLSKSELGAQYAKRMVASMADAKVAYIDVALDDGSHGYGCDYHLNAAGHRVAAQTLADAIAAKFGWK